MYNKISNGQIHTVGVKFQSGTGIFGGPEYCYNTTLSLNQGDLCVVAVDGIYHIVGVTNLHGDPSKATKCIVSKVDRSAYDNAIGIQTRYNELNADMKKILDRYSVMDLCRIVANHNDEMRTLLNEADSLRY